MKRSDQALLAMLEHASGGRSKPEIMPPPPPPRYPIVGRFDGWIVGLLLAAGLVLVLASFALFIGACVKGPDSPAATTRAQARAAMLTIADATKLADSTCANVARAKGSVELAARCDTSYQQIRASLVGMATAVDAWDAAADGKETVVCIIHEAAASLSRMVADIHNADAGQWLPAADDAIALVNVLGACHMSGDAGHE